jgi:hypothetical protein
MTSYCVAIGLDASVKPCAGKYNIVVGIGATVESGDHNVVIGGAHKVNGNNNIVISSTPQTINGDNRVIIDCDENNSNKYTPKDIYRVVYGAFYKFAQELHANKPELCCIINDSNTIIK